VCPDHTVLGSSTPFDTEQRIARVRNAFVSTQDKEEEGGHVINTNHLLFIFTAFFLENKLTANF
jgi:hypothetical protein